MKRIYRIKGCISFLLTFVMITSLFSFEISAEDRAPISLPHESDEAMYDLFGGGLEETANALELNGVSAVLLEAETGTVLYEKNADEALPPASVTKIMTLLLVMEALDEGTITMEDRVTVSAHAASMGGSQVFLEEGEEMLLEDLLKSVVIASANDAAVALAEHVAGSEEAFVTRMNQRAAELGAVSARFENTNGLDDTAKDHVMSARDIAIISRALIAHKEILKYSSIWMDTIRNGAFGLTNTNRLVRFYPGCTGLKTGSTSKAGFCVSVTAEREGLSLIAVIMGAETRDARNASATKLLDFGFANFALVRIPAGSVSEIPVKGGVKSLCRASYPEFSAVVRKSDKNNVQFEATVVPMLAGAIEKGMNVGEVIYSCQGKSLGRTEVKADESIERIGYKDLLIRFVRCVLLSRRAE